MKHLKHILTGVGLAVVLYGLVVWTQPPQATAQDIPQIPQKMGSAEKEIARFSLFQKGENLHFKVEAHESITPCEVLTYMDTLKTIYCEN